MYLRHLAIVPRSATAVIFAATTAISALVPTARVSEAADTEARLEVVVQQVVIHDDNEGIFSGEGEMDFSASIWRCPGWVPLPCDDFSGVGGIGGGGAHFNASTGDVVALDMLVPQGAVKDADSPAGSGFPVYAGYHHILRFSMSEDDGGSSSSDDMGDVTQVIDTTDHGLGIGTHTARSNNGSGDYTVTYEIRRAQLPDLRPVDIKIEDQPTSAKKLVCMVVQNTATTDSGPFDTTLRIGGAVPTGGVVKSDGVVSNYWRDVCVQTELTAGEHVLTATVDELAALPEFNESNNVLERKFVVAGPPPVSQADLVVSSIRVRGQEPDAKDDCKEGRNDVAFTIQNLGGTAAGAYIARLTVDDDDPLEKAVPGLDPGKSLDVTLEDVRIKKRTHALYATADAKNTVTESNENNNTKSVSVTCKDDE